MKNLFEKLKLITGKLNKYWIAIIIFVIFTFFVGESTIWKRISYDRQINRLEQEIEHYTRQKEMNEKRLQDLQSDNESLEKLAREQYRMTKKNEELFIIEE
ncbi:MAG: septum formation initiator family protein [Dysgonamonadaceae bacterium]|jgi:cell division protein FtsB|nr:septum formation initiator family protein [Dysgonamonadaceae bacterium]